MRSKHFWHSVCGLRSAPEELMSEAIMLDCIRTYGMSQSDRKNNIVNRLGNIDKAVAATTKVEELPMKNKMKQLERKRRENDEVGGYVDLALTNVESTISTIASLTTAQIMSPPVTHVTLNSVLDLTCFVRGDANTISWWINGTKVDMTYILSRGGIFIDTTRPTKGQTQTTSKLIVAEFTHLDVGRYECRGEKPGFVEQYPAKDSVSVIVIDPSTNSPLLYQASEITDEPSASNGNIVKLCMFLLVICCVM